MISGILFSLGLIAGIISGPPKPLDCKVENALRRPFVPNRVLVRLSGPPQDPAAVRTLLQQKFGTSDLTIRNVGSTGTLVVDSPSIDLSQLPLSPAFVEDDRFVYIQPDPYIFAHGTRDPDDPHFNDKKANLWGLIDIAAPAAWLHSTGSRDVVVAVVDGGVELGHEDLQKLWTSAVDIGGCPPGSEGYDAIDDRCTFRVRGDHGTRMAGAIGASGNNGKGVVGVNWTVALLSSGFMQDGKGCATTAMNALKFVRLAKETGAANVRVANLSWGTTFDSDAIRDELKMMADDDIVLVASAGNAELDQPAVDLDKTPLYPASYRFDTLLAVANTMRDETLNSSSNFGKTTVHLGAPGTTIWTTSTEGFHYKKEFGTSIAAAYVSGAVALLASRCPALSAKNLTDLLLTYADTRDTLLDKVKDRKALNVGRAMAYCVCQAESQTN